MRCKKHKRYKGKLRPRCSCFDCWIMYIESNFDLETINYGINHQREFHGGDSFCGNTDDMLISNYLREKKRELESRV